MWRAEIVPAAPVEATPAPEEPPPVADADKGDVLAVPAKKRRPDSRIPWAQLLKRVFLEDVLACPCGGRRRVIAFITDGKVVRSILEHLGLPTTGPPVAPARSTVRTDLQGWQDDVPALQQALR